MHSPVLQTILIDARIEDIRRSRGASIHRRRTRDWRILHAFAHSAMPRLVVVGQAPTARSGRRS
jgi:hypothetical protein